MQACNAAAERVMGELSVPINDLHALVVEAGADGLLGPDGVHFGAEGIDDWAMRWRRSCVTPSWRRGWSGRRRAPELTEAHKNPFGKLSA